MQIAQSKVNEINVIGVSGRLDIKYAQELENHILDLLKQDEKQLVINLEKLEFISSSGLRVLLFTAKQINRLNGKLALCGLKERVKETFDMVGFTALFNIYADEKSATSNL